MAGMLDGDSAHSPGGVNIDLHILIYIARLGDFRIAEFDVQRIGLLKVLDLHGRKSSDSIQI
jgi:hypothetical protein